LAPFIEESSINGLAIAASAALSARFSPEASPVPNHGLAHFAHDRTHVGEIEVDEAFLDHQIGDAGDAGIKHLVGHRKGVRKGSVFSFAHAEQVLVRDDEQRVDDLVQLLDAGFGHPHAAHALEVEWLGDDADGKNAELLGATRYHRRRAGAGPTAHAGRHEHHMGPREVVADFVNHLLGCRTPRPRAGSRRQAPRSPAHPSG